MFASIIFNCFCLQYNEAVAGHAERLQTHMQSLTKNSLMHQFTEEFMKLPDRDDPVTWWRRLPFIYIPFMFRRRILQLIIFTGKDLKSGVLNEFFPTYSC
jgi:hypothetical protein